MHTISHAWSSSLRSVDIRMGSIQTTKGAWSGMQPGPGPKKSLVLDVCSWCRNAEFMSLRAAQKIDNGPSAWVTVVPTLLCSILFSSILL